MAPSQPAGRDAQRRPSGVPRAMLMAVMTVVVVSALGWGPLLIVVGAVQVHRADEIGDNGVTTTATVLDEQASGDPASCGGLQVSYRTRSGHAERAMVNADSCVPSGSELEVIYDPETPHTARLASLGRTDAWVDVVSGIVLSGLVWSLAAYGVADAVRARRARRA